MKLNKEILKTEIIKSGMTMSELSSKTGYSRAWLYNILKNGSCSDSTLIEILDVLQTEIKADELLEFEPKEYKSRSKTVFLDIPTIYCWMIDNRKTKEEFFMAAGIGYRSYTRFLSIGKCNIKYAKKMADVMGVDIDEITTH